MSLAINATDIAIVSKNHSAKLPAYSKRVSRRQFNKLMTQKTRTQKKRWADRSRFNARDMKRSGWEFTEQDQLREEDRAMEMYAEDFLADLKRGAFDVDGWKPYNDVSITPVTLSPISSLDASQLTPVQLVRSPNLSPVTLSRSPSPDCYVEEDLVLEPTSAFVSELLSVSDRILESVGKVSYRQLAFVQHELYTTSCGGVDAASSLTHEQLKILFCFITSFPNTQNLSPEAYASYLSIKVQQFMNHFIDL